MWKKTCVAFVFVVIGCIVWWSIRNMPIFHSMEWKTVDWRFALRGKQTPHKDIVIISIDEKTFHKLKQKYPFPPITYGQLIDKLNSFGAIVIGFDLLYSEPTRECNPPDQDVILSGIIEKAGNVLWGCELENGETIIQPIGPIKNSIIDTGFLNFPDEIDNRIRRFKVKKGDTYSLAAAIMKAYAGFMPPQWNEKELYLIDFCGPSGSFPRFSMTDVLNGNLNKMSVSGKLCLVGPTFLASHDYYATPFHNPSQPDMPGVELHANVIHTLLTGHQFTFDFSVWWIVLYVGILFWGTIFLVFGHVIRAILVGVFAVISWTIFSIYSFHQFIVVPLALPVIVAIVLYLSSGLFTFFIERKEKNRIKGLFASYVDPEIVTYLLKHTDMVNTTGIKIKATILYTDIEGFSDISSTRTPEELVSQLNEYFETLTGIVIEHNGMYDKYVGDALMAIFGFPVPQPDQTQKAVCAALKIQSTLEILNTRWRNQNQPVFNTRIGISTGEVIIGPVGGTNRKDFTAYGTVVNRAARLEAFNKTLNTRILIDQETADGLSSDITLINHGEQKLKGIHQPVTVYQPKP